MSVSFIYNFFLLNRCTFTTNYYEISPITEILISICFSHILRDDSDYFSDLARSMENLVRGGENVKTWYSAKSWKFKHLESAEEDGPTRLSRNSLRSLMTESPSLI